MKQLKLSKHESRIRSEDFKRRFLILYGSYLEQTRKRPALILAGPKLFDFLTQIFSDLEGNPRIVITDSPIQYKFMDINIVCVERPGHYLELL